jgi:hypothetical protein
VGKIVPDRVAGPDCRSLSLSSLQWLPSTQNCICTVADHV